MVTGRIAGLALAMLAGCGSVQVPEFLRPPPPVLPEATATGLPIEADGTALMPLVGQAEAERGLRGTILRVRGAAPTQGFYDAELRPIPAEGGVLGFEFRARPPLAAQAAGPERTRTLTTATFLSRRALRDITAARVVAAGGSVAVPLR